MLFVSAYGFGYNESQDDYKVVKVEPSCKRNEFGEFELLNDVSVYSLKTNSWEMILEKFPSVCFRNDPAKFVSGRLHWIATRNRDNIGPWFIASLNLIDLTYEEVALPPYVDNDNIKWKLGILGGNLCLFCHYNNILMDVWIMMENGVVESWTKVVSIPYFVELDYGLWPIFISQNDDIFLQGCSSLLLYNSTHNDLKQTKTQIHYSSRVQFSLYIESLVPPNFVEED
ncbi:F-box/kelch-repeat protein At3g23880-like [Nicotiana tabacum]|uniref:F-box/kelch-repeat protein At3g23880-like n=1 Tax=Nicotiana tabacum TaxID=4097 RepID=A0AC58SN31_TOBAC